MFAMPSRWALFRYFLQQTHTQMVRTRMRNEANGAMMYSHIRSEHFGTSHNSMTFSTD